MPNPTLLWSHADCQVSVGFKVCTPLLQFSDYRKLFFCHQNIHSLLQITSYWMTLYQKCASKWCPPVLSRRVSLCTVNSDSWLHLKLWGRYTLDGSLFTLYPPPIFSLSSLPLLLCPSVRLECFQWVHTWIDFVGNIKPQGGFCQGHRICALNVCFYRREEHKHIGLSF